jgi:hypothetical protein
MLNALENIPAVSEAASVLLVVVILWFCVIAVIVKHKDE